MNQNQINNLLTVIAVALLLYAAYQYYCYLKYKAQANRTLQGQPLVAEPIYNAPVESMPIVTPGSPAPSPTPGGGDIIGGLVTPPQTTPGPYLGSR